MYFFLDEYAFSNVELTQNMGTIMNIDESPFCMSMFVAMCTTCRMFIQIFVNNPSELIEQKMIIPKLVSFLCLYLSVL